MKGGILKAGNLVLCSQDVFVNNEKMAKADPQLLPRELIYMTHGNVLELSGISEVDVAGMRKLVGDVASRATAFAILRYSEKTGAWMRTDCSHFESAVDCLLRERGGLMSGHLDEL